MEKYDVIVLGGGPGGYVAAIWLAKAGVKTCLIEGHKLGGTCLNYGCIPTKALYHYAKVLHTIKKHNDLGIRTSEPVIDLSVIQENKSNAVKTLVEGVKTLVNKNKIDLIEGYGRFVDDHVIEIEMVKKQLSETEDDMASDNNQINSKVRVEGDYIVIATGSEPIIPNIKGLDEAMNTGVAITSKEALELEEVPKRLAIIGGGVIGMEFATIYNQLGSDVTVYEATDSILPSFNKDLVKRYKPLAKKQGIKVLPKTMVTEIEEGSVTAQTKKGEMTETYDRIICAVGRKPKFNHIQADESLSDGRKLLVNDTMQTAKKHIYAIGDVNGLSLLAHSASKQGVIAGTKIIESLKLKGRDELAQVPEVKGFSAYAIPQVAFLLPEISQVQNMNYNEEAKYLDGKFNYRSNGMALGMKESDGICKVSYDEQGDVLVYMGILGESSGELIHQGVHSMDHHLDFNGLTGSVAGHPSLTEIVHEALLDLKKLGIHQI